MFSSLKSSILVCWLLLFGTAIAFQSVAFVGRQSFLPTTTCIDMAPISADGSDYSPKKSDYDDEEYIDQNVYDQFDNDSGSSSPAVECQPVPMSKNAGNRFVAMVWDADVDTHGRNILELHEDRNNLIEDHVMFARKRNLYNETFNADSMVDIMHSYQVLSSDLLRVVGHALVLESPEVAHINEMMKEEPILNSLTGGDISTIQLYRWRHIRDFTLRWDDGRFGFPCMMVAFDEDPEVVGNLRSETRNATLEYMIRSERVIATGALHMSTEFKDDPSSIALGDLIFFNAKDREEAIKYAEDLPSAKAGLYKSMQVQFYNQLDVTGKFVTQHPREPNPCGDMQEALKYWGYPTSDDQTPHLNW